MMFKYVFRDALRREFTVYAPTLGETRKNLRAGLGGEIQLFPELVSMEEVLPATTRLVEVE